MTKARKRTSNRSKKARGARWQPKPSYVLLILIAAIGGPLIIKLSAHKFFHRHQERNAATKLSEWKRSFPEGSRLSLELPGELQREDAPTPESSRRTIKEATRYKHSSGAFEVAVWDITYLEGVPTDLRRAAEGAASTLKESGGITDYQDTVTPATCSGQPCLRMSATFKRYGISSRLEAILIGQGSKLWQVIATFQASAADAPFAVQRVLDSVRIS